MTDPRFTRLAELLVNYSMELEKGEKVLLDMIDVPDEFTVELIRATRGVGAIPLVETRHTRVAREVLLGTDQEHATTVRDVEMFRMKRIDLKSTRLNSSHLVISYAVYCLKKTKTHSTN